MHKAFEKVKEDEGIMEAIDKVDSDEEIEKAFKLLWPDVPFKLHEVLSEEKFQPWWFVEETKLKGLKLKEFSHNE